MAQLTPLLLESFATAAVMVVDWPGFKEVAPADNEIVIWIPAGVPPPPHAAKKTNPATNTTAENARTLPPLPYVIDGDSLRQLSRIESPAGKCSRVARGLNYQSGLLNVERAVSSVRGPLGLRRLRKRLEVAAKNLLQIRHRRSLPGHAKHRALRGNVFPHHSSSSTLDLMNGVGCALRGFQGALHLRLIFVDRGDVSAQGG